MEEKNYYTIGREIDCDIYLDDITNVASRLHATLRIDKKGKYYLTDQSSNGTYVNGMRLTPGLEVEVNRGDSISFAHVQELDWALIPKPKGNKKVVLWSVLGSVLGAITIAGLAWLIVFLVGSKTPKGGNGTGDNGEQEPTELVEPNEGDSINQSEPKVVEVTVDEPKKKDTPKATSTPTKTTDKTEVKTEKNNESNNEEETESADNDTKNSKVSNIKESLKGSKSGKKGEKTDSEEEEKTNNRQVAL